MYTYCYSLWLFRLFVSLFKKNKLSVNKLQESHPQTAKIIFIISCSSTVFHIPHLKKKQKIPFPTRTSDACVAIKMSLEFESLAKSVLQLFPGCIETKSLKSVLDRWINCLKENLLCLLIWMSWYLSCISIHTYYF